MSDEPDAIEDTRNSLLAHFSSKSTNQTVILLGLAVLLFTFVQADPILNIPFRWNVALVTLFLGTIIFITLRAFRKLVYYGEMASAIFFVKECDVEETKERIEKDKLPIMNHDPPHLVRFMYACTKYSKEKVNGKLKHNSVYVAYRLVCYPCFFYAYWVALIAIWAIEILWAIPVI